MRPVDPVRLEHILNTVSERTGVTIADMIIRGASGDRFRPEVRVARNIAYWTAYRSGHGKISMQTIGKRFGRDHDTVSSGIAIVERRREADADFKRMTDDIRLLLAAPVTEADIRRGSACVGPDGKKWVVTQVDDEPETLQCVTMKNEIGATVTFPRRDAAKWLRLIALLPVMLTAVPAIAHHGDSSRHIIDQSIQQATLPSMQPRTLDIVNPHRLVAPPYVIPQSSNPVYERPAQRRQPCARWIDEGCR